MTFNIFILITLLYIFSAILVVSYFVTTIKQQYAIIDIGTDLIHKLDQVCKEYEVTIATLKEKIKLLENK